MNQDSWRAVDAYLNSHLVPDDPTGPDAGLPDIAVAPTEGKLLNLLARMTGARSVLEVGTLGGYSTNWLASALPADGRLITLEADPAHAEVARRNLDRAGLSNVVEVRVGPALDSLPTLRDLAPFDLVFVDADKPNNPRYFTWALELSKPGSVIVVDNVVRDGGVADPANTDPGILGTREMIDLIAAEPRVDATALQTVGPKGHDGLLIALVTG